METKLQVFYNEESNVNIRTRNIDNEPWFVAKDVCDALGLANSRKATTSLDDDEKRVSPVVTPSGEQLMTIINESGLYNLIFQSRKPEARAFRKWVTGEVLPAIRRTGVFGRLDEETKRHRLPQPKYRPYFDEWKQRVRPYISRDELEMTADQLEVTLGHVQKVYAGTTMSGRIVREITDYAKYNRKRNVIYPEPQPVHRQMVIEWDKEDAPEANTASVAAREAPSQGQSDKAKACEECWNPLRRHRPLRNEPRHQDTVHPSGEPTTVETDCGQQQGRASGQAPQNSTKPQAGDSPSSHGTHPHTDQTFQRSLKDRFR